MRFSAPQANAVATKAQLVHAQPTGPSAAGSMAGPIGKTTYGVLSQPSRMDSREWLTSSRGCRGSGTTDTGVTRQ